MKNVWQNQTAARHYRASWWLLQKKVTSLMYCIAFPEEDVSKAEAKHYTTINRA